MRSLHPQRLSRNLLVHGDISDVARHQDESCQLQPPGQSDHPAEDCSVPRRGRQRGRDVS
jgi:hypothetical protein